MSQPTDPKEAAPAESSRFGKRLGWTICVVLVVLAALVAIVQFGDGSNSAVEQPVQESPFK